MVANGAPFHARGVGGVLFQPLKTAFVCALLFIVLIVMAWSIDLVMVLHVWPQGVEALRALLDEELARAEAIALKAGFAQGGAVAVANALYALVFKVTGLHDMGLRFADSGPLSIPDTVVRKAYLAFHDWIEVAMVGTQLFGARLATLFMSLPAFALAYVVATADGFVQRAIRRTGGGRESASLYHRAKHLQLLVAVFAVAACLLLPSSMDLRWIGYPAIVMLAVLARVQWSYYKKYL